MFSGEYNFGFRCGWKFEWQLGCFPLIMILMCELTFKVKFLIKIAFYISNELPGIFCIYYRVQNSIWSCWTSSHP